MSLSPGAASALEKWRARWPEWSIGAVFVPAAQRDVSFAWLALLQEFTDAAWGGSDAIPGLAKLAWWNEELLGWVKGARRHPLGEFLLTRQAAWDELVRALRPLQALRGVTPLHADSADLRAAAAAISACEVAVLQPTESADANAHVVALDLLREHALMHAAAATRIGADDGARSAAAGTCARVRRLQALQHERGLQAAAKGGTASPAHPLRTLRLAWRAARGEA